MLFGTLTILSASLLQLLSTNTQTTSGCEGYWYHLYPDEVQPEGGMSFHVSTSGVVTEMHTDAPSQVARATELTATRVSFQGVYGQSHIVGCDPIKGKAEFIANSGTGTALTRGRENIYDMGQRNGWDFTH